MPIVTISSKGQITVPAALRREFRIAPNDKLSIEKSKEGIILRPATDIFAFKGKYKAHRKLDKDSIEQIVAEAVAEHRLGKRPK